MLLEGCWPQLKWCSRRDWKCKSTWSPFKSIIRLTAQSLNKGSFLRCVHLNHLFLVTLALCDFVSKWLVSDSSVNHCGFLMDSKLYNIWYLHADGISISLLTESHTLQTDLKNIFRVRWSVVVPALLYCCYRRCCLQRWWWFSLQMFPHHLVLLVQLEYWLRRFHLLPVENKASKENICYKTEGKVQKNPYQLSWEFLIKRHRS